MFYEHNEDGKVEIKQDYDGIGDLLNKSLAYDKVLKDAGFRRNGDGIKPWSLRYTNEDGKHVEIRSSEWTYETSTGTGPELLKTFLAEV